MDTRARCQNVVGGKTVLNPHYPWNDGLKVLCSLKKPLRSQIKCYPGGKTT